MTVKICQQSCADWKPTKFAKQHNNTHLQSLIYVSHKRIMQFSHNAFFHILQMFVSSLTSSPKIILILNSSLCLLRQRTTKPSEASENSQPIQAQRRSLLTCWIPKVQPWRMRSLAQTLCAFSASLSTMASCVEVSLMWLRSRGAGL